MAMTKGEGFLSSGFMELLKQAKTLQIQLILREIGQKYKGSDAEKLRAEARHTFNIDSVKDYNFGITGQSGVGKSSLINALCGYEINDPRAAPIDITQCTMAMERYAHPYLKHLVLYDLPGAGTEEHPIERYFCDKRLYVFDCLLLVMSQRVYQNDLAIARMAQEMDTRVVFVRNKAMGDLDTMKRKHPYQPESEVIEMTVAKIKNDIVKDLEKVGIRDPVVFVIEAHSFLNWNFKFDEFALLEYVTKLASARCKTKLDKEEKKKGSSVFGSYSSSSGASNTAKFDKEEKKGSGHWYNAYGYSSSSGASNTAKFDKEEKKGSGHWYNAYGYLGSSGASNTAKFDKEKKGSGSWSNVYGFSSSSGASNTAKFDKEKKGSGSLSNVYGYSSSSDASNTAKFDKGEKTGSGSWSNVYGYSSSSGANNIDNASASAPVQPPTIYEGHVSNTDDIGRNEDMDEAFECV